MGIPGLRRLGAAGALGALLAAPSCGGGYGLGMEIWPVARGTVVGHSGGNRGWRTRMVAIPARGFGLVILTNGENGQSLTDEVTCEWMRRTGSAPAVCR